MPTPLFATVSKVGAVKAVLGKLDVTKATVRGKNMDGFDDILHLANNPDPFGMWDLKKGPTPTTVVVNDVSGSLLVKVMAGIVKKHPEHFGDRR